MTADSSDAVELLRQSKGDPDVLGRVWEQYRARLLRLVRLRMDRRLQGRVDSSDVLQEAFVDFASRLDEYLRQPQMPFYQRSPGFFDKNRERP